jgi:dTDP-4-dehydrorhamnose reductase
MRVLITGADGQLGTDLCRVLQNVEITPCTHSDLDVTDALSIRAVFNRHQPEVVINTAAYLRVDDCEDEKERAFAVNTLGARNIAVACQETGAVLAHVSTDYVFGGKTEPRASPYIESDLPLPCNTYGRSKLAGEALVQDACARHVIIRTSGLFGTAGSSGKGGNFVETVIRMAREGRELRIISDQMFSPTYSKDLAQKIGEIIRSGHYGVFHVTNRGSCSWFELARTILAVLGMDNALVPITSAQHPQKARRPPYSVLGNRRLELLGIDKMRTWQEALTGYFKDKGHLPQESS